MISSRRLPDSAIDEQPVPTPLREVADNNSNNTPPASSMRCVLHMSD
jgi:hypothetical protein